MTTSLCQAVLSGGVWQMAHGQERNLPVKVCTMITQDRTACTHSKKYVKCSGWFD